MNYKEEKTVELRSGGNKVRVQALGHTYTAMKFNKEIYIYKICAKRKR